MALRTQLPTSARLSSRQSAGLPLAARPLAPRARTLRTSTVALAIPGEILVRARRIAALRELGRRSGGA